MDVYNQKTISVCMQKKNTKRVGKAHNEHNIVVTVTSKGNPTNFWIIGTKNV